MQPDFDAPAAAAQIIGSSQFPNIRGTVFFAPTGRNVLVTADIHGLPHSGGPCQSGIFAFHIHEGAACSGPDFADTGGHFNPHNCPHPHHAGDLPPLFECNGRAFMVVMTDRFRVQDVIGRTVIIHSGPDDFTTQPSGNAGSKIACGVIRAV